MAPKPARKQLDPTNPLHQLMPIVLSGRPEIEKQGMTLVIEARTIGGPGGAYCAKLLWDGHTESCVALRRNTTRAFELFQVLNKCSHPNIAKPFGVWEDKSKELGYIVFHNFDGVLSSVPKQILFEMGDPSELKPAQNGFSKIGYNILLDLMSAVNYVNNHYEQEPSQAGNNIPLKSLRIEACTVFFQLKENEDYLVLLTDCESIQDVKGQRKRRGAAKARSTGEPDVHEICTRNWNNIGKYIEKLCAGCSPNFEVTHLLDRLKDEAAKYDDLVWEAGLWDLSTKIYFLREIFWCYDKVPTRKGELKKRLALGLQSCIAELNVEEKLNNDPLDSRTQAFQETDLFKSLHFLRVFLFAHQAEVLEKCGVPKGDFEDKKSAERFVLTRKGDYMVKIIQEIRALNWIKTSPHLRSRSSYMIERDNPQK